MSDTAIKFRKSFACGGVEIASMRFRRRFANGTVGILVISVNPKTGAPWSGFQLAWLTTTARGRMPGLDQGIGFIRIRGPNPEVAHDQPRSGRRIGSRLNKYNDRARRLVSPLEGGGSR